MAQSEYTILMNYTNAKKTATKLDSIAAQVKSNQGKVVDTNHNIQQAWKSENATAYAKKVEIVSANLTTIEKNLKKIAETIRTNAKRTYDAEMRAAQIAKERNYGG